MASYAAVVIAMLAAMLATLPWERDGSVSYSLERSTNITPQEADINIGEYSRTTVYFTSQGVRCHAWLYMPKHTTEPPPIVVMAHGLGAQKDFGLHKNAERFALHGLAVLVFDYRTFGGSDGEPRNWASPRRHIEDWHAAVHFAQELGAHGKVNAKRLVLWGSSFAGGHVLVTAAALGTNVSAVVSQVPHLSGIEASKRALLVRGVLGTLRLLAVALHDRARAALGLSPAYVPLVARPGELGFMLLDDHEMKAYYSKHPPQRMGGWQNKALARLALETSRYSPIDELHRVVSPVLLISAAKDSLCPAEVVAAAAAKLGPQAEVVQEECTHFDIYGNRHWENVITQTLAFLDKHLSHGAPPTLTQ